jgi:RimJ/RimL family protein N-acetyltransferase
MMRKKMEETDAPTLQTDCFTLRRLQSEDAEALHRISNAPLVRRYLWDDEPVSRAVIEAVIARGIRAFSKGRVGLFRVR